MWNFTECFCTNSKEKFKLHIIHQHFLKILSKYFFYFQRTPYLSLALPQILLLSCFTLFLSASLLPQHSFLQYLCYQSKHYSPSFYISMFFLFLILFLCRPIQHSGALKCVSSTSTFFRIPPSHKELIFEDVHGGCSREIGNKFNVIFSN